MTQAFDLSGRIAVVTGGGGVLGGSMAQALARAGARVAVLGRTAATLDARVEAIQAAGGDGRALVADVLDRDALDAARASLEADWGAADILVNAAGGNRPGATIPPGGSFFDLDVAEFGAVFDLNLVGTVLPTLVFGQGMAQRARGSVVNVSSMASARPLTRVVGYSAAKAAVDSFTRWLAVEAATKLGAGLRVNAIAPGFFVTEQNRRMLTEPDGSPTARGRAVLEHTPAGRFGDPEDLDGALLWLCSDTASFVTGTVVAVDGGFGAFSGV